MNEKRNLDLKLGYENYNMLFISGSLLICFLAINLFSYKFQKDFSNVNIPSKLIVSLLASFIGIIISIVFFTFYNILNINNSDITSIFNKNIDFTKIKDLNENGHQYSSATINNVSSSLNLFVTALNFIFYFVIPMIIFYLIEEKNCDENNANNQTLSENKNCNNNNNIDEVDYFKLENDGINSVQNQISEMDYIQILKNFSFHITAFISLNIIYLIIYKTCSSSSASLLEFYSLIPEALRVYSALSSDVEILNYLNLLVIFIIAKFGILIYLPYGLGKVTALLIDNLKNSQELRQEFNNLNSGLSKNVGLIKQITTQKLMTGKNLSKKEKNILRQCKETQTLLEHKQEVLEEKYSRFKICFFYILFPVKFFMIIISILISLLFLFSKVTVLYSEFTYSKCGKYCGFFTDKIQSSIALQDIYGYILSNAVNIFYMKNPNFIILSICCFYIYFLISIVFSLKTLGIFHVAKLFTSCDIFRFKLNWVNTSDIRSDKILSVVFYTLFFIIALIGISEILNLTPSIAFYMENYNKCTINNTQNNACNFSYFMLFSMKNVANFSSGYIANLLIEIIIIILSAIYIVYFPIKSTLNFVRDDMRKRFQEECC